LLSGGNENGAVKRFAADFPKRPVSIAGSCQSTSEVGKLILHFRTTSCTNQQGLIEPAGQVKSRDGHRALLRRLKRQTSEAAFKLPAHFYYLPHKPVVAEEGRRNQHAGVMIFGRAS